MVADSKQFLRDLLNTEYKSKIDESLKAAILHGVPNYEDEAEFGYPSDSTGEEFDISGSEGYVLVDTTESPAPTRFYKAKFIEPVQGRKLYDILARVVLQNIFFPECPYKLEGKALIGDQKVLLVSQDFIDGTHNVNHVDVKKELCKRGWSFLKDGSPVGFRWIGDYNIKISDYGWNNVLRNSEGYYFIDPYFVVELKNKNDA